MNLVKLIVACIFGLEQRPYFATDYIKDLKRFPADWDTHGRAAGVIRNKQMAEYGDMLIAFWDGESKGTKNMIDTSKKLGLLVYVHRY
jgi:hypothetical protein